MSLAGVLTSNVGAAPKKESKGDKVARNLRNHRTSGKGNSVKVVVQLNGPMSNGLASLLKKNGTSVKKHFQYFNSASIELSANVIEELAAYDEVDFVSGDDEVVGARSRNFDHRR